MRYLSLFTPAPGKEPPTKEYMDRMNNFIEQSFKSGSLVMTEGLLPITNGGVRLQSKGGEIAILDGPYAETREAVGGFAILQANSREELIELCQSFLRVAGDGDTRAYQMMQAPPQPA